MKKHIPNMLTCGNVVFGCLGIEQALNADYRQAFIFMLIAAGFDFFDGFAARLLKVSSPVGKELDSLADVITFGVLPGFVMYSLLGKYGEFWPYAGLIIPAFSALRLAHFNLDTRQSDRFIGVPTPANALFISSLPFVITQGPEFIAQILDNPFVLVGICIVTSLLLVSELPLIALKFKDYSFKNNLFRYILLAGGAVSAALLGVASVPVIFILYVGLSFVESKVSPES